MIDPSTCDYCGEPIEWPKTRYCSEPHKRADYRLHHSATSDGSLPVESEEAAFEWDGNSHYSVVPELVYPYERKCFACSRSTPTELLTHRRAVLFSQAGIPPCPHCGGSMYMALDTVSLSSPIRAVPVRTKAQPVRPLGRSA